MKIINLYTVDGMWYYALWIDSEFDHNDDLEATSEIEARAELSWRWPDADIRLIE